MPNAKSLAPQASPAQPEQEPSPAVGQGQQNQQDQYHRQMFEKNRAVKLLIDPSTGEIKDANPAAAEFYGYSIAQLKQMRISQINALPPEQIAVEMQKLLAGSQSCFEFQHRLANGEIRYVEVYPSKLEVDGKSLIFEIIHDVTARRRAEDEIKQLNADLEQRIAERTELVAAQHEALAAILDNSPVSIAFYDRDLRLLQANIMWERITGFEREAALGRLLTDFPIAKQYDFEPVCARVLAGETVKLENMQYLRADNNKQSYFDITYAPVRGDENIVQGFVSIIVDMTDRQELSMQKDLFMAIASHELKTPITSIKGLAYMGAKAADKLGDERLARNLKTIDQQTNRLTRMIDDMLDISRIRSGMFELNIETFDLCRSVEQAVEAAKLAALEFTFALQLPPTPQMVDADKLRIEQALNNLLQNAVKYSDYAGSKRAVEVALTVHDGEATTSVRDYGVGIPDESQPHLFEPFYRAQDTAKTQSGLGLGLFIAHSIISKHKGRMWVESKEGEGSVFYFSLPMKG